MGLQHAQQRAQLFTLPSKDRSPRDAFLLEGVWARTSAAQLRSSREGAEASAKANRL